MRWGLAIFACLAFVVLAPGAGAEQASSFKQKRLLAGFVDGGGKHTCAIVAQGHTTCWGDETFGQLGGGPLGDDYVSLGAARKGLAVAAGSVHTCAILDTGAVLCWGSGADGRLGYGNTDNVGVDERPDERGGPVRLGAGRRAIAIAAGDAHTCAILDTGAVRCWGSGGSGRLGYGNTDDVGDNETPASVATVNLGAGRKAVAITAGQSHTCAILDTGAVRCWGAGGNGRLGYGNTDDIGDNETPDTAGPVDLGEGRTALAITAGDAHTCAILDTKAVYCWGSGGSGRLGYGNTDDIGDGETPDTAGPVNLGTGRTALAVTAGDAHTCAILDTEAVRCWGSGANGRLGYGNTDAIGDGETPETAGPVSLGTGRRALSISAGYAHTCALLDTGKLRCWGAGANGRLGNFPNNDIGDDETPETVDPVDIYYPMATAVKPLLLLTTKPYKDHTAPFTVTAFGTLGRVIAIPATCNGKVKVQAKKGAKTITKLVALKLTAGSCTYTTKITVKSAGTWKVYATFPGNSYLKSASGYSKLFYAG